MSRSGLIVTAVFLCALLLGLVASLVWVFLKPDANFDEAELRIYPDQVHFRITPGQNYTISCSWRGRNKGSLRWLNSTGTSIPFYGDPRTEFQGESLLLKFQHPTLEASGTYRCSGFHENREFTKTIEVKVYGTKPAFRKSYEALNFQQYQNVSVACSAGGTRPIKYVWYKETEYIFENGWRYRITPSMEGSLLHINEAKTSDSGHFSCVARNDYGSATKVFDVRIDEDGSPKFDTDYQNVAVSAGHGFDLLCRAAGSTPMRYDWYDPEEDLVSANTSSSVYAVSTDEESRLVFERVRLEDSGIYTCTASNALGLSSLLFDVNVTQGAGPFFSTPFENLTAEAGSLLEILCLADNDNGTEKYAWYNQLSQIVGSDQQSAVHASATGRGSVLTISAADTSGVYECRSRNDRGWASKFYAVGVVSVSESVPRFFEDYESVIFEEGSRAELECSASGEEPIQYSWFNKFNEQISEEPDSMEYTKMVGNSSFLIIKRVSLHHKGDYVCRATNRYGMASKIFDVSVYPSTANQTNETYSILHVRVRDVTWSSVTFDVVTTADADTVHVNFTEKMDGSNSTSFKTDEEIVIENLVPGGFYQFQFRANNGSWSKTYTVTLPPDVPQVIIRNALPERLEIEWFRPIDDIFRNTTLKYEISYYTVQMYRGSYWTYNDGCSIVITVPPCRGSSYAITGLAKRQYYELAVRAATSAGFGLPYKHKFYFP